MAPPDPLTAAPASDPLTPDAWHVAVTVPAAAAAAMEAALDPDGIAVSVLELEDNGPHRVEAWSDTPPDEAALAARVAVAAAAAGIAPPPLQIERVAGRDWAEASRRAFPPVVLGRFVVHGSHAAPPPGKIALQIDANLAFGTGEHPTTAGCLAALEDLAKRRQVTRALDMGTGTAILAMGISRLWPGAACLGVDIDAKSVAVARSNLADNRLDRRIRLVAGDGFATPAVRRAAPFDLIVANILAGPLSAMASDLAAALAPGGTAILSGIMAHQQARVLAAYRQAGLRLVRRRLRGVWATLELAGRTHPAK
ncbi:MAG: 50S ribosomal protein L11 methyltransferase [Rhodospirillaceae bacterium]|nr:50S ribosomal protein L11 methyltransferase [Rhodospirillaceae bacterium]